MEYEQSVSRRPQTHVEIERRIVRLLHSNGPTLT